MKIEPLKLRDNKEAIELLQKWQKEYEVLEAKAAWAEKAKTQLEQAVRYLESLDANRMWVKETKQILSEWPGDMSQKDEKTDI